MIKKEKPIVSVVMPAYNSAKTIGQAIESVLIQEVPLELLVIDDGSVDETEDIVKDYVKAYQDHELYTVCYIKNEKNMGAAKTRNRAVALARSQWIAFLDADDWWAKDKLKKQFSLLKKTNAVLCCTARQLVDPDGHEKNHIIHVQPEITYKKLLLHNSINCSSVVVKKDVMLEYPMCHEDSHEDYISWLKILKAHQRAVGIDEALLYYRLSTTGKSGNKLKSARMNFKVYRYMGFGLIKSILLFISYAFHGIKKYVFKG